MNTAIDLCSEDRIRALREAADWEAAHPLEPILEDAAILAVCLLNLSDPHPHPDMLQIEVTEAISRILPRLYERGLLNPFIKDGHLGMWTQI